MTIGNENNKYDIWQTVWLSRFRTHPCRWVYYKGTSAQYLNKKMCTLKIVTSMFLARRKAWHFEQICNCNVAGRTLIAADQQSSKVDHLSWGYTMESKWECFQWQSTNSERRTLSLHTATSGTKAEAAKSLCNTIQRSHLWGKIFTSKNHAKEEGIPLIQQRRAIQ